MRVRTESMADGVFVLMLEGEVDLHTAPVLNRALQTAIKEGATLVVVDCSEITFIDSTMLGVLVGGVKRLRPLGGELSLVVSDRNIRKIFELTLLDRILAIYGTREEALVRPVVEPLVEG